MIQSEGFFDTVRRYCAFCNESLPTGSACYTRIGKKEWIVHCERCSERARRQCFKKKLECKEVTNG